MGFNIGSVFLELLADGARLQADVTKEALKAGDAGGKTLGARLSASLNGSFKGVAFGAIGTALGGAFGVALTGANQLDEATKRLQADTGMTADEAAKAEHAMAGMFRTNLQSFDEISAAMAAVHNDLGLVGQAADDTTAKFLKFSTATGQDAADAVKQADDTLDAWNLTADHAGALLDQLTASHQKYGGSIAENERALSVLAPQLQALGMTIDDGIGLLNLFAATGLDATKATFALNTAVKNLKPGQSLNDLIRQIAAIEDPTLRAQEAIKVFGARGGVALANALRPGITSLDDFKISAADAAGATDKAAAAVESGFGAQFKLILKNAGGALAEFGTNFGALIMAASVVGPKMTSIITAAFGALAASGPVMAAAAFAGGAAETAYIKGLYAVEAIQGVLTAAWLKVPGNAALKAAASSAGASVGLAFVAGFVAVVTVVPWLKDQMLAAWKDLTGVDLSLDPSLENQFKKNFKQLGTDAGAAFADGTRPMGEHAGQAIAEGVKSAAPGMGSALAYYGKSVVQFGLDAAKLAKAAGNRAGEALAQGITEARQKPVDAFDKLVEMLKHPLKVTGEVSRLMGQLMSEKLAEGLRNGDPAIRAQANATKQSIIDRLNELKPSAKVISKETAAAIAAGLRSGDPDIRAAAQRLQDSITGKLQGTVGPAGAAGTAAGTSYIAALRKAVQSADVVARIRVTSSGGGVGTIGGRAAGGPVSAGTLYRVNEHQTEYFRPNVGGTVVPLAPSGAVGGPAITAPSLPALPGIGTAARLPGMGATSFTLNGGLHLHGVGSDVTPAAATRFGQSVLDVVASGLREQNARRGS